MDDLSNHRVSDAIKRKAAAEGLDLDKLRREQPEHYKMLNSVPLLYSDPALTPSAGEVFFELFPNKSLYQLMDSSGAELLRAFPDLSPEETERLDNALGRLVGQAGFQDVFAYYRVVNDLQGERRELALPVAPAKWRGQTALVGPFEDEAAAQRWGDENVSGLQAASTLPYAGRYFCDVFFSGGL